MEDGGDLGGGDPVTDPQICEAHDLGEGAHHNHVPPLPDIGKHIGRILEKLVIRLVKDHQHVIRHRRHEPVYLLLADHRPGGIVWVGDEDRPGFGSDSGNYCVEICRETRIGHLHGVCAEKLGHEFVDRKGMTGHHDFITGSKKRMPDEFNDLVRSIPKNNVQTVNAEPFSDRIAEFITPSVGIEVGTLKGSPHGIQSLWRGAERIFIRGQFDDILLTQAQITGQLFDRLSGFINGQAQDMLMGGFPHGDHSTAGSSGRKVGR